MTYTQNHHLPQWEPTDPVRMSDFNDAMSTIDTGLNNTASQTLSLSNITNYNLYLFHLQARRSGLDLTAAQNMACNSLTSVDELSALSEYCPNDGGGIRLGKDTSLTLDRINAATSDWVDLSLPEVNSAGTASVNFRTDQAGTISRLQAWFSRTSPGTSGELTMGVRLYDLASQSYTYTQKVAVPPEVLADAETTYTFDLSIPLAANRNYRLELQKSISAAWKGNLGWGAKGARKLVGAVVHAPILQGTLALPVPLARTAAQAAAVVHYSGTGAVSVSANGKPMAAGTARTVARTSGETCTQRIFTLSGSFSGTPVLTLNASATEAQELVVYDFGGYLT